MNSHKIIFLGDKKSGKTAFINRFIDGKDGKFETEYQPTSGVFPVKVNLEGQGVGATIYDTTGSEEFDDSLPSFLSQANTIVLVWDETNYKSFARARKLQALAKKHAPTGCKFVFVANKCELFHDSAVKDEGAAFAAEHGASFFYVSAEKNLCYGDDKQECGDLRMLFGEARSPLILPDKPSSEKKLKDGPLSAAQRRQVDTELGLLRTQINLLNGPIVCDHLFKAALENVHAVANDVYQRGEVLQSGCEHFIAFLQSIHDEHGLIGSYKTLRDEHSKPIHLLRGPLPESYIQAARSVDQALTRYSACMTDLSGHPSLDRKLGGVALCLLGVFLMTSAILLGLATLGVLPFALPAIAAGAVGYSLIVYGVALVTGVAFTGGGVCLWRSRPTKQGVAAAAEAFEKEVRKDICVERAKLIADRERREEDKRELNVSIDDDAYDFVLQSPAPAQ